MNWEKVMLYTIGILLLVGGVMAVTTIRDTTSDFGRGTFTDLNATGTGVIGGVTLSDETMQTGDTLYNESGVYRNNTKVNDASVDVCRYDGTNPEVYTQCDVVCSGSDCATILQNVLDTYSTIYFGSGTFPYSKTLSINDENIIKGAGMENTVFQYTGNAYAFNLSNVPSSRTEYWVLYGFSISFTGSPIGGLDLFGSRHGYVDSVEINNDKAKLLKTCVRISGNDGGTSLSATNNQFYRMKVYSCENGFQFNGVRNTGQANENTIMYSIISGTNVSINISVGDVNKIIGNNFAAYNKYGLLIEDNNIMTASNRFESIYTPIYDIYLTNNSLRCNLFGDSYSDGGYFDNGTSNQNVNPRGSYLSEIYKVSSIIGVNDTGTGGILYIDGRRDSTSAGIKIRSPDASGVPADRIQITGHANTANVIFDTANIDVDTNIIKNIGTTDTDFTATGGLKLDDTLVMGDGSVQRNITMTSPDASEWCCGVNNTGSFSCSSGAC
jgi:hypothetical protein